MSPEDLKALNKSLSESVNLFQAIHVLQTSEEGEAFRNETSAGEQKIRVYISNFTAHCKGRLF